MYEYALLELNGEISMKILGIDYNLFHDSNLAKSWYENLLEFVVSDEAVNKLNNIYEQMYGRDK